MDRPERHMRLNFILAAEQPAAFQVAKD
ncbi:hypothetical protein HaLaN_27990, partial [Haematococcus lacustris]